MLEVTNLSAGYRGAEVLHGASFCAKAGQITALIGPNGCGKSTLLKCICGIVPPLGGSVLLDGSDLMHLEKKRLAQKVSCLAQNRQIPDITVERLVLHGRFPYLSYPRRYRREDMDAARAAMQRMDLLHLSQTPLQQLSGGQQQRAYIAMTIAQDADVVLLDEPTTYLDVSYQMQLLSQARMLADGGKHVIMVIHDLSRALESADHVMLMDAGRVILQGSADAVYASGCMQDVFRVKVLRTRLDDRWCYVCRAL